MMSSQKSISDYYKVTQSENSLKSRQKKRTLSIVSSTSQSTTKSTQRMKSKQDELVLTLTNMISDSSDDSGADFEVKRPRIINKSLTKRAQTVQKNLKKTPSPEKRKLPKSCAGKLPSSSETEVVAKRRTVRRLFDDSSSEESMETRNSPVESLTPIAEDVTVRESIVEMLEEDFLERVDNSSQTEIQNIETAEEFLETDLISGNIGEKLKSLTKENIESTLGDRNSAQTSSINTITNLSTRSTTPGSVTTINSPPLTPPTSNSSTNSSPPTPATINTSLPTPSASSPATYSSPSTSPPRNTSPPTKINTSIQTSPPKQSTPEKIPISQLSRSLNVACQTSPPKNQPQTIAKQSTNTRLTSPNTSPTKKRIQTTPKKLINTTLVASQTASQSNTSPTKKQIQTTPKKLANTLVASQTSAQLKTPPKNGVIKSKFKYTPGQMTLQQIFSNQKMVPTPKSPEKDDIVVRAKTKNEIMYNFETHSRVCDHVCKIVKWVIGREFFNILFTKREIDLLKKLFELPNINHRIICIRLLTRKHKWYNLSNLCELLNLTKDQVQFKETLRVLSEEKFVEIDFSKEPLPILINYLSAPDLKDICQSFRLKPSTNRQGNIDLLLKHAVHQSTLTTVRKTDDILRDRITKKMGICVKLNAEFRDILLRIHVLYSLTSGDIETLQDIYEILNKIRTEQLKIPDYKIDSTLVFANRPEFIKYYNAYVLRKEFEEEFVKKDLHSQYLLCRKAFELFQDSFEDSELVDSDQNKPVYLRRFSPAWIYCSVISSGCLNLGKHYPQDMTHWLTELLKQDVYCVHKRGLWYTQLAMIQQAHLKNISAAITTIIEGLSDKHVTVVSSYELSIRGAKIKRGKVPQLLFDQLQLVLLPELDEIDSTIIHARKCQNDDYQKIRRVTYVWNTPAGTEYGSVEETAIYDYTKRQNYTNGIHCEGRLIITLFFIYFWDIIYYTHVPNTFLTEIQKYPLDLHTITFYPNRKDKIDARLADIRTNWSLDHLCQFLSKILHIYSKEIAAVISDFGDENTFQIWVRCIGKTVLADIFERLVKNYKRFHSGMPDLFVWNSKEFKCCFVEVKSENDILSTRQVLWINYLKRIGARAEVCYVETMGSSSTKRMKKKI